MVLSNCSIGQFDNLELRLADLRLDHVTIDSTSGDLISITSVKQHVLPNSDTVGIFGGDDLLLTRQQHDFTVIDYLQFGSAFNDEAALVISDGDYTTVGGLFWDTLFIDETALTTHLSGRGIFLATLDAKFKWNSGTTLSGNNLIRLGDGMILKNGNLLTIGWVVGDLYVEDQIIKPDHIGMFLIEWKDDFSIAQMKFWTVSGRVGRASLFSNNNQSFAMVTFQDSLSFDGNTLVTRNSNLSNSALIKLDGELNTVAHLFFQSTFNNSYVLDDQFQPDNIPVIINFRGNLKVEHVTLNGLPQSDQSAQFVIDNQANILTYESYASGTGGTLFSSTSVSKDLFVGTGLFANWLESPASSTWIYRNVGGQNPYFLDLQGDDIIFDNSISTEGRLLVTGIYRGLLQVGDLSEFNNKSSYQPFALSFNSTIEMPKPNNAILVQPNPVNELFEVKPLIPGAEFYFWNMAGKLVLSGSLTQKINVAAIIPGFYILEIRADGKKWTQSIIRTSQPN